MMKTVLVFRTTGLECWQHKLAGIRRFANARGWRLQVIDGDISSNQVANLLDFWEAPGCIVEADGGDTKLRPGHFRGTPVVFLDHTPTSSARVVCRPSRSEQSRASRQRTAATRFSRLRLVGWVSTPTDVDQRELSIVLELPANGYMSSAGSRDRGGTLSPATPSAGRKLPNRAAYLVNDYIAERAFRAAALDTKSPRIAFVGPTTRLTAKRLGPR
jgi:hypothetical protein